MRRGSWRSLGYGIALAAGVLAGAACRTAGQPLVNTSPKASLTSGSHLESTDPALRDSLARLALVPSAEADRDVAFQYLRLGIRDRAYDHLEAAVARDPKDAASYDGLARIWRDWGFPSHGLAEAQRAVKYAPRSPIAYNTLGTLYEAMNLPHEARQAYWRAVELDSHAAYALANLTRLLGVQLSEARRADTLDAPVSAPKNAPKKETP